MIYNLLQASLEGGRIVTIIYQKNSEITKRNIKVISMKDDNIKAFCYLRHQVREFKLDNILAADFYKVEDNRKIC